MDIFKKDKNNKTGLDYALQNGHEKAANWLIIKQQKISQKNLTFCILTELENNNAVNTSLFRDE